jgi:AcrR family transcriptional regulator
MKSLNDLKQKEKEDRRILILNTALDLFSTRDFRQVTSREIARAAGMSAGTLFNYYRNMDELFLDIFLKNAGDLAERIRSECGEPPLLRDLCDFYISYLNDHMVFYQMMGLFMIGSGLSQESTKKLNHYMRSLLDTLEESVKTAGIQGNTREVAHALFSALNGIMISYARYPGRTPENIRGYTRKLADIVACAFLSLDGNNLALGG